MELKTKLLDPTGRVIRIREDDDRGERFPIIQGGPASCAGIGLYTEVFRTENMERARRGHITFTVDLSVNDASTFGSLFLEVNVIGYVNGAAQVVEYLTMDQNTLGEYEWAEPESFSNIALEVRQNIDGVVAATTIGITYLRLNVAGAYWR